MLAVLLLTTSAPASGQTPVFTADSLNQSVDLTERAWRFKAGDDLVWADPDFDDSDWMIVPSLISLGPDSIADKWNGIGWFRLDVRIDSNVTENLLFLISQSGASEIYLDGTKAGSVGAVSPTREGYTYMNQSGYPVTVSNRGSTDLAIAIRYANHDLPRWLGPLVMSGLTGRFPVLQTGAEVSLGTVNHQMQSLRSQASRYRFISVFAGLLAGLALVGFLIYMLRRSDRAILYLTAHIGAMSALFAVLPGPMSTGHSFLAAAVSISSLVVLMFAAFAFMVIGVARAFFPERRYVHAWVWTLTGVCLVAIYLPDESLEPIVVLGTGLLILDALQMVARAAWRRQTGAIAVGVGILSLASLLLIPSFPLFVGLLAISAFPVSIIILIAQRYSRTSRELGKQLEHVERLSEEKLEAEREKQKLIRRQNEELNERVEERTAELSSALSHLKSTQAQLVEQEKLASLGSLTAGIAHEIKNPLNFVNNFAEVSEELMDELAAAVSAGDADEASALLDDLRQNARQIAKHGGRADSIVRSMMQHAHGGASERETMDVNAFVEEYVDLAWHGMRARNHEFQCDVKRALDPDAGTIEGQPQELGRVLLNLLNNAFYAVGMEGAAAEPIVRIETARTDGHVTITVTDSGPGIPDHIREKIFEPFFTTKPTGEGTGLGLSLSYDIVTKGHGGEMSVENAPGAGARFTVRIPAA